MMLDRRKILELLAGVSITMLAPARFAYAKKGTTAMRTPAAAEAERAPPSCIRGFKHSAVPLEVGDLNLAVDFRLACSACSAEHFQISSFPLVAPNPSPYYQI